VAPVEEPVAAVEPQRAVEEAVVDIAVADKRAVDTPAADRPAAEKRVAGAADRAVADSRVAAAAGREAEDMEDIAAAVRKADKAAAAQASLPVGAVVDKRAAAVAALLRWRPWRRSRDIPYKPEELRARTAGKST
jgi:hypothetical protein